MEAIVFGTGKVGREAIPYLEKQYHILFWADNDEKKQGSMLENYPVKSPEEIKKYNCTVIITSTKYSIEIARQLKQMGVGDGRICLCRRLQADDTYEYEAYPMVAEKVPCTGIPLVQYDLYHEEEQETGCRKVLIFCLFFSTYTKQLIENMSGRYEDIEFSILTNAKESAEKIKSEQLKHIYYFRRMADLKTILEQLPMYDAMQLLWMEREWAYFYKLIRRKTRRLNLNVGGSDFYRAGELERNFKRGLIEYADTITAETVATIHDFETFYGNSIKNKLSLLPFGIEILELINKSECLPKKVIKQKYNIPFDKIVVTCGHNASCEHQHAEIIDAINDLPEELKKQLICVFPMTYPQGQQEYIHKIEKKIKAIGQQHITLTKFMSFQEMAEYALISDVMIHVQSTDQLSSTMLEEMYAGSIVITGKWLPYQSLHEMGMFFLDIDSIVDLAVSLEDIILNLKRYKKNCIVNKEIIWEHSSWERLASRWHELWN